MSRAAADGLTAMDPREPRRHRPASGRRWCATPLLGAARRSDRFDRRVVALAPGEEIELPAAEWRDALVVVEAGALELEGLAGTRRQVGSGAVLWLAGLPLRAVRNAGRHPAVLVAVRRRAR